MLHASPLHATQVMEVFGGLGNMEVAVVMFLAMILFLFRKAADYGYDCTC